MIDKQSHPKRSVPKSGLRPGQDFLPPKKQTKNYPMVGMTLSSYRKTEPPKSAGKPVDKPTPQPISNPSPQTLPVALSTKPRDPSAKNTGSKGRIRKNFTLKKVVLTLLIVVLCLGGWVGGKFLYNTHKLFGGSLLGLIHATKLKGEDAGRVNILLAGNSADDTGHNGAELTDSIMLISLDTKNNTGFMMSVPRDLWVDVPGSGYAKINSAYVTGNQQNFTQDGLPSGGMGALESVIERNFNITINYYALVNYSAFRDAVNAVGGIDVVIKSSDPRGLYDPNRDYVTKGPLVKLSNGKHHLNGEQALDLARARGDPNPYGYPYGFPNSDFDRTAHQRQMLVALKTKAESAGVLANPAKLTSLFDALGKNIRTDMTLAEVHRLYDLTKSIDVNAVQSVSLNDAYGKNLLMNYTAPDGESTLAPAAGIDAYSKIQAFLTQLMSPNLAAREGATIVILNASNTAGLATAQKAALTAKGLTVGAVGDARSTQTKTTIIDASGGSKPATKKILQAKYGNNFTTANPYSAVYDADFIVLLGTDSVPKTNTNTTQ